MMNGSGTRLRDVCALRYDVAQSLLSAGGVGGANDGVIFFFHAWKISLKQQELGLGRELMGSHGTRPL